MEPKKPATAKSDRKLVRVADLKTKKDPKGGVENHNSSRSNKTN